MSAKGKINNGHLMIRCPACGHSHVLNVDPASGRPCWTFNGDLERPTVAPSLLVRCGHYVTGQPQPPNCARCNEAEKESYPSACYVCHSFIRDGMIEFLSDCTHHLAGQTVPLPDWEAKVE